VPTIRFTTHACHTAENQSQISPGLKRFRICNAQNQIQCLTGSNPAVFGKRICAKKTWQPGAVLLQGIEIAIFGGNTYKNPNVFAGQFSQTALFQKHAGIFFPSQSNGTAIRLFSIHLQPALSPDISTLQRCCDDTIVAQPTLQDAGSVCPRRSVCMYSARRQVGMHVTDLEVCAAKSG